MSPWTVLVLGGVRAGKSAFAVARARALGGRVVFVATAEAGDPEMAARILRHQAGRPPAWRTVEVPLELAVGLDRARGCGRRGHRGLSQPLGRKPHPEKAGALDADLLAEAAGLEAVVARPPFALILVSNEVGWGVHPETALGRRFRDALGLVNQAVARAETRSC